LHEQLEDILSAIDGKIADLSPQALQEELQRVPLEVLGRIQIDRPAQFPNLMAWLPSMPSKGTQRAWTGEADHALLGKSVNFIRMAIGGHQGTTGKPISQGSALDFGCGWGRMIRLLYKYVPADRIYGVDPWDESIRLCKECSLHANLFVSDYVPRSLPTPTETRFDLIIAFSVFTHLSEKVAKIAAGTLRDVLSETGTIALSIRPREYWLRDVKFVSKQEARQFLRDHDDKGFAFFPHKRAKIEGEVTYGDTSMSLDFIRSNFEGLRIAGVEWSELDPLQLIVFLKKSSDA